MHQDLAAQERTQRRRLSIVVVVIGAFFGVELAGAKAARSDVLEADAYHLLMDVLALAVSLAAMRLASARPSDRFTFGLRRLEPVAALFNGALVLAVAIELVRDALEHLSGGQTPRSEIMLVVASAALVVNGFAAWLVHGAMHGSHHGHAHDHGHAHGHAHAHDHDHGHDHDEDRPRRRGHAHHLNLRGAWLHLVGDAMGSLAAFGAGLAIRFGAPHVVDPIASFVVVTILVVGAVRLLRDALYVLLDAAPARIEVTEVKRILLDHPGVAEVHALHVWSLGTGHDAITAHVRARSPDVSLATRVSELLRTKFAAEYVTVQVEAEE